MEGPRASFWDGERTEGTGWEAAQGKGPGPCDQVSTQTPVASCQTSVVKQTKGLREVLG